VLMPLLDVLQSEPAIIPERNSATNMATFKSSTTWSVAAWRSWSCSSAQTFSVQQVSIVSVCGEHRYRYVFSSLTKIADTSIVLALVRDKDNPVPSDALAIPAFPVFPLERHDNSSERIVCHLP
jgi:hypothetical protein